MNTWLFTAAWSCIFTMHVAAQPHYLLNVACDGPLGDCTLNVTWSCDQGTAPPATSCSPGVNLFIHDSQTVTLNGLICEDAENNISFQIDTEHHLLKNFTASFGDANNNDFIGCMSNAPGTGGDVGSVTYNLHFDPVPYTGSVKDSIVVRDTVYRALDTTVGSFLHLNGRQYCTGTAECVSSTSHFLGLLLVNSDVLSVPRDLNILSTPFSISSGPDVIEAHFSRRSSTDWMEVYNVLGSKIISYAVTEGVNTFEIPRMDLPAGFYIARLHNEIAKFVVTP